MQAQSSQGLCRYFVCFVCCKIHNISFAGKAAKFSVKLHLDLFLPCSISFKLGIGWSASKCIPKTPDAYFDPNDNLSTTMNVKDYSTVIDIVF